MPIQAWIIGAFAAVVLIGGSIAYIYREGKDAGAGAVTGAVQSKTIETITGAREAKEKADAEVRTMPYDEKVNGLGK